MRRVWLQCIESQEEECRQVQLVNAFELHSQGKSGAERASGVDAMETQGKEPAKRQVAERAE